MTINLKKFIELGKGNKSNRASDNNVQTEIANLLVFTWLAKKWIYESAFSTTNKRTKKSSEKIKKNQEKREEVS